MEGKMTVNEAKKQAEIFMRKSGYMVGWTRIRTATHTNDTIRLNGSAYNIHGTKKIPLN